MDISADEFFVTFGKSINELILTHRPDLEENAKPRGCHPNQECAGGWDTGVFVAHLCTAQTLPRGSVYPHRTHVRDVVRSMLNFHRVADFNWGERTGGLQVLATHG